MAEYNYENPTYEKDDYDEFDEEDMDAGMMNLKKLYKSEVLILMKCLG